MVIFGGLLAAAALDLEMFDKVDDKFRKIHTLSITENSILCDTTNLGLMRYNIPKYEHY
jgi:hypothetical protein